MKYQFEIDAIDTPMAVETTLLENVMMADYFNDLYPFAHRIDTLLDRGNAARIDGHEWRIIVMECNALGARHGE